MSGGADKKSIAEEAVVEATLAERARHTLIMGSHRTDCSCGVNLSAPSVTMEHELFAGHVERCALAAALGVTLDGPCPTCGGTGTDPRASRLRAERCPAGCSGGRVPGESALAVLLGFEQVGWGWQDGDESGGQTFPWNVVVLRDKPEWEPTCVPVYRVVSPEEPKP